MYPYNAFQNQNILPQQQIIQANGKASIDALRMAPNSSVLIMDTTAPMVWMCVSDGIGNVSATAYDIAVHKDPEPVDVNSLDARLAAIEKTLTEVLHGKSNALTAQQIGDNGESFTDQAGVGPVKRRKKSAGDAESDDAE